MKYSSLTLGCCLLLTGHSAQAIINGKIVHSDVFPAQSTVIVWKQLKPVGHGRWKNAQCSGTLIGDDLVLTAAHCLEEKSEAGGRVYVQFGNSVGKEGSGEKIFVSQALSHPQYCPTCQSAKDRQNDIALLKLETSASGGFKPVRIVRDSSWPYKNRETIIAGYGNIYYYGDSREPRSRKLRYLITKIRHTGNSSLVGVSRSRGGMAGGDSGGPAFLLEDNVPYVYGVAHGYLDEDQTIPIYESTAWHYSWIAESAVQLGSRLTE